MSTGEIGYSTQELMMDVERLKAAQTMGKIAAGLESQAQELRQSIANLNLELIEAPEGYVFSIAVNRHEGTLRIEPFQHRSVDWGDPYKPGDVEYENLVSRSRWGDNASINVDTLGCSDFEVWGYDTLRRVRVLVDHNVRVDVAENPASEQA